MGRCIGGSVVEGKLNELRVALQEYYGGLNELKVGLRKEPPEMPEALKLWKKCKKLGIPLVAGGVLEQPHIWLLEVGVVTEVEELYSIINAAADAQEGQQGQNNETRPRLDSGIR
jgi:hypothetical protein